MSEIKDGGPAFPVPEHEYAPGLTVGQHEGMTLRDWLAGKAVSAVIAKTGAYDHISEANTHKLAAKIAYEIADAMISARSQP